MYWQSEKKLVKQQYLLRMSPQYGELWPTSGWDRFVSLGHSCKFQRVLRLGSITARHSGIGVSQTLRRWTEGTTYIRQGGHHVGHWPTFLVLYDSEKNFNWDKITPSVSKKITCRDIAFDCFTNDCVTCDRVSLWVCYMWQSQLMRWLFHQWVCYVTEPAHECVTCDRASSWVCYVWQSRLMSVLRVTEPAYECVTCDRAGLRDDWGRKADDECHGFLRFLNNKGLKLFFFIYFINFCHYLLIFLLVSQYYVRRCGLLLTTS